jgi:hypothetical protein
VNAVGFCRVSSRRPIYEFRGPHSMQYRNLFSKWMTFRNSIDCKDVSKQNRYITLAEENAVGGRTPGSVPFLWFLPVLLP